MASIVSVIDIKWPQERISNYTNLILCFFLIVTFEFFTQTETTNTFITFDTTIYLFSIITLII